MKRWLILIITIFLTLMPIIVLLILSCFGNTMLTDNDFWYSYLGYVGTVLLAGLALYQTQKISDDSDVSQQKYEQYQNELVEANKRANEISNLLLKLQTQNSKACFVPMFFCETDTNLISKHFFKTINTRNIGKDYAFVKKTCCVCGGQKIQKDNLNTFVANDTKMSVISFEVNPSAQAEKLTLYLYLENPYGFKYVQALDIMYSNSTSYYKYEGSNVRYFDTWLINEVEDTPNGQT